jgi:hypothetical protein
MLRVLDQKHTLMKPHLNFEFVQKYYENRVLSTLEPMPSGCLSLDQPEPEDPLKNTQ